MKKNWLPLTLLATLTFPLIAQTFRPPTEWGAAQGNPFKESGQPRWRFDQIRPANPEDADAYVVMKWDEGRKAWHNVPGSQGGQPDAKMENGNARIEVRARGGGDSEFVKGAALVFIAPQDGMYRFAVDAIDIHRWEGGTTTFLMVLKRFQKNDGWSVEPVFKTALEPKNGNTLEPVEMSLKKGDELAVVPWHDGHWSGATVTFVKPSVTRTGNFTAVKSALPAALPFELFAKTTSAGRPLPAQSGVANVRDYGAAGDGKTDDTAAIQKAITDNRNRGGRVVYFPAGTYLVSDKLTYGDNLELAKFLTLQGQGRDLTTIRLRDNCPDFDQRKAVVSLFEGPTTGMAFNNSVYDLTIDVGSGNPGAVALEWMQNNTGSGERLRLRAPAGSGSVGFDLTRHEPGPGLIRDVIIEGFDYGVFSVQTCFSMTFENILFKGQRKAAIRNNTQTLFLRRIRSENNCPAIIFADQTPFGGVCVIDSEFIGTGPEAAKTAAIVCGQPWIFTRNIRQQGYAKLIDPGLDGAEKKGDWWGSVGAQVSAFPGVKPAMLNLPVKESPDIPWDAPDKWAVVNPQRLDETYDDSAVIQEALDWAVANGKTSLLVPGGRRVLYGSTINVPANIRRIYGCDAMSGLTPDMAKSRAAVWRVTAGATPLVIERFYNEDFARALPVRNCVWIEHASQRPLLMAHGSSACDPYRGTPASRNADVFVDDWVGQFQFNGQNVWMRQFNPESNGEMLVNDGGTVWIFGSKTESETGTWIVTRNGGKTELLGGYNYPSWRHPKSPAPKPLFMVENGSFSAVVKEQVFHGYMAYPVTLRHTRGGVTKDIGRECVTGAWIGNVLALPQ